MAGLLPVLTATAPNDPGRWCAVVGLPHGVVAWALYRDDTCLAHGVRDDADRDTVFRDITRQLPL